MKNKILFFIITLMIYVNSFAAEEKTAYIDKLREKINAADSEKSSTQGFERYTEREQEKLKSQNPDSPSYSESLKKKLKTSVDESSYTEREAAKLKKSSTESRSEFSLENLRLKRPGAITQALGFRLGVSRSNNVRTAPGVGSGRSFESVYGSGWYPDFALFYEYQPFHSEYLGSFGLYGSAGFSMFKGQGQFSVALPGFSSSSQTEFRFWTFPITAGLSYRFNLLNFVRPYITLGVTAVGFTESRTDDVPYSQGISKGYTVTGGVSILLDWLSDAVAWQAYDSMDAKHLYFVMEYHRLNSFGSESVIFETSGLSAGFSFEM